MKKALSLLVFLFFAAQFLTAQKLTISDSATISIITCSPGEELYAKFGHTALRIQDNTNQLDIVFNFGIFNFDTKSFYLKFINGETDYQLGVYDTPLFLAQYDERNSFVWQQTLHLNPSEKNKLISALLTHYEPENRLYRYNFAYDNCSTRPLNLLKLSLDGYIEYTYNSEPETFRTWIRKYLGQYTWASFGIDLIFGMDADKIANRYESLFLPEVLMSEFQYAKVVDKSDQKRSLVSKKSTLIEKESNKDNVNNIKLNSPLVAFSMVLLVGILLSFLRRVNRSVVKSFDTALLLISGLVGIFLMYMMQFSEHPLVGKNLNLLWLNPLNSIAAVLLWIRSTRKVLFYYQVINISLLVFALLVFGASVQDFNLAAFLIIVLMLLRYTKWAARAKRKIYSPRPSRRKFSTKGFS